MTQKESMECLLRALAELRRGMPKEPPRLVEMYHGAICEVHDVIDEMNRVMAQNEARKAKG